MKILQHDFAEFDARFVWNDAETESVSAKSVQKSLEDLRDIIKNKSIADLDKLKSDKETNEVLNKAHNELNDYRRAILNGNIEPPQNNLKESTVDNIIEDTFTDETNKIKLREALGVSNPNSKIQDADDVFDLDEFAESQRFIGENFDLMLKKVTKNMSSLPESQDTKKLKLILENISKEILPLQQKMASSNEAESDQVKEDIQQRITFELSKNNFDMGLMLEKFAKIAKNNPENDSDDIDNALEQYVRDNSSDLPTETSEAPEHTMMETYAQNPEIAKFLADYYPTPGKKSLKDDLDKYNVTSLDELPEFFLNASFGTRTTSIKSELKNYQGAAQFAKLQAAIIAEERNSAPASGLISSVTDSFKDVWTSVKSFLPDSFEHFQWTEDDVKNATSVEELFTNKMRQVLLGENPDSDSENPYSKPKKSLNLGSLDSLTKPLNLEDNVDMIDWMRKDIPTGYRGSEWAEKYRESLVEGKTRKNFENWLSKDSGISVPERIGNKISHNFLFYFYQILSWFRNDWATRELEKIKKDREESEEDNPYKKKINDALKTNKEKDEINNTKKSWEKPKNTALKTEFQKFCETEKTKNPNIEYNKLVDFGNFEDILGKIKPDEFAKWNTPKSREILAWGATSVPYEKIKLENWKYLVNKNATIETKKDKSGRPILDKHKKEIKVIKVSRENASDREITVWNDSAIEKSDQDSAQEIAFQSLKSPENGEGIFDDSVTSDLFFDHKNELFENPEDPEGGTFREPFASLFVLDKKFYGEKLSYEDLDALIKNSDKIKGGVKDTETTDDRYWTVKNGKAKKIEGEKEVPTFEVDIKGEREWFRLDWNQDFDSMKALIARLKK